MVLILLEKCVHDEGKGVKIALDVGDHRRWQIRRLYSTGVMTCSLVDYIVKKRLITCDKMSD